MGCFTRFSHRTSHRDTSVTCFSNPADVLIKSNSTPSWLTLKVTVQVFWCGVLLDTYALSVYHLQWMTVSSPSCVEKQHVAPAGKHWTMSCETRPTQGRRILANIYIHWSVRYILNISGALHSWVTQCGVSTAVLVHRNTYVGGLGNVVPQERAVWRQWEAPKLFKTWRTFPVGAVQPYDLSSLWPRSDTTRDVQRLIHSPARS